MPRQCDMAFFLCGISSVKIFLLINQTLTRDMVILNIDEKV